MHINLYILNTYTYIFWIIIMIWIKFICNLFHIFIIKPYMKTKTKSIPFIQCSPIFECCMYVCFLCVLREISIIHPVYPSLWGNVFSSTGCYAVYWLDHVLLFISSLWERILILCSFLWFCFCFTSLTANVKSYHLCLVFVIYWLYSKSRFSKCLIINHIICDDTISLLLALSLHLESCIWK